MTFSVPVPGTKAVTQVKRVHNGLESNNLEVIGKQLQRMAKTERTDGEYKEIVTVVW